MIDRVKRWLTPPDFPDDELKTRRAMLLNTILLVFIVGAVPITGVELLDGQPFNVITVIPLIVFLCFVPLFLLLKRGKVELVGIGVTGLALASMGAAHLAKGTVYDPVVGYYIFVVVIAGLLFSWRGVAAIVLCISLIVLGVILAEEAGLLTRPPALSGFVLWLIYTALTVMMAWVVVFGNQTAQQALRRADQEITERKKTEQSLRQSEAVLRRQQAFSRALHDTALDLLNRRQINDLLQAIVERAAVILDAPYAELMLTAGDELIVQAYTANQPYLAGDRVRRGEALLSWQAHDTGQPALLDDYSVWAAHRNLYDAISLRAVADFPIMAGQTCLGVLGLGRAQPDRPFTPEEIEQGVLFSQLAAVVIDNANLYASALHELAERQQAEAALRESNIELRTRNEELDAYAHTVAHDLKNPLGAVVGYVELLQSYDTLPSEIIQRILVGLQRSGQKATNIVEALLLLSSVRQQEIQAQPLNMADLIEEVLARLAETIRDSGVDLHLPDRASWPIALGYAPWVEEIWVNYISNAIKYGGAQPRIELSAERLPDGFVRYNVRDYGAGLTSEQQQRLFTPFERLGQAQIKGHGLGLSVVRRIAEKLSGQVGVESSGAPGEGSTFYFTLPGIPPEGYLFSPTSV